MVDTFKEYMENDHETEPRDLEKIRSQVIGLGKFKNIMKITLIKSESEPSTEEYVGQNIALTGSTGNNYSTVKVLVQQWEDGVNYFNKSSVSHLPKKIDELVHKMQWDDAIAQKMTNCAIMKNITKVGDYTQMVYGNTRKIGCGQIFYKQPNDSYGEILFGLQLWPRWKYSGAPVYMIKE
ncbi:venom allergen 5 [Harpegnathos saltator]|uniref:venom allergen 5 n=1 Tax=Harpegnathos saltator TaxID=610380 RepID=UPI000DBED302|nr:venom allergen 5 [Harpegnathos saltator]